MESERFDYVIVGAGSAGCLLANRLSADPRYRVALIEAGGKDNWIWLHIPVGYLYAIGNPRSDWMFQTQPDPGLNGRSLAYPRGKVLGGSSAINAMIYMRGQAVDYDRWRQIGLTGWGWDDVLPLFRRHEDHFAGASAVHGAGGELHVEEARAHWEILDAFQHAAAESGIPPTDDFNTGVNEGCGYFHVNQRHGRRWSAASAFLKPVLDRPNLEVFTDRLADHIAIEDGRATGVAVRFGDQATYIDADGEVILAAGAVQSPALLERSGIGDGDRLFDAGIDVIHELPGVGENLQDHLQLRLIYEVSGVSTLNTETQSWLRRVGMAAEYALLRRGPLSMAPSHLGAFTRSSPEYATPNIEFHVQPLSLDKFGDPLHRFNAFTVSVCNLRPTSRGSIHVVSPHAARPPAIVPRYLSTEADRRVAVDSIRTARRIAAAPALELYAPEEYLPGAGFESDDDLAYAAGDIGTTIFHPVGTAKMGLASDPGAVTDERLRVHGIDGLRVIDASVMPFITSGNTNAPTMMIAEKGAEMVIEDAREDRRRWRVAPAVRTGR